MYLLTGKVESISDVLDIMDIAGFFSPTFVNPIFRFLSVVKYEDLDCKNPRFANIPLFDIDL